MRRYAFFHAFGAGTVTIALALSSLFPPVAAAQPHGRPPGHERYQTPHWVYDDRYHHDHFYPAPGYSVAVLPPGHVVVSFRNGRYYFHAGVWYHAVGPNFVVVRPPIGIVVPVLPPMYATVWVAGVPYYYANEAYYVAAPGGYAVAQPPAEPAAAPPAPPPAPPAQAAGPPSPTAPGNWYYCESSKRYFPYVQECKEGWRVVPATPPRTP